MVKFPGPKAVAAQPVQLGQFANLANPILLQNTPAMGYFSMFTSHSTRVRRNNQRALRHMHPIYHPVLQATSCIFKKASLHSPSYLPFHHPNPMDKLLALPIDEMLNTANPRHALRIHVSLD